MHSMPDARECGQRLDIEMDQVAGLRPFVSRIDGRGAQPRQAIQAGPAQDRRDRRARHLEPDRDGPGRPTLIARGEDAQRTAGEVRRGC